MLPVLFHIGSVLIPAYGAVTALGVLLALLLAEHTAGKTGLSAKQVWNLCVVSLVAALVGSRLFLVVWNWHDLLQHPLWMLGLAMIHHPLVAVAGAITGGTVAWLYAQRVGISGAALADALAAPLALVVGFEQLGALLAGSGYGLETTAHWAVTYTDTRAALWSGTPLGVPLHPVQGYAALVSFAICVGAWGMLSHKRSVGDVAGMTLLLGGVGLFVTEFFRDREGRGAWLGGALDGPQIAAIGLVLAGGWMLRQRREKVLVEARVEEEGSNE